MRIVRQVRLVRLVRRVLSAAVIALPMVAQSQATPTPATLVQVTARADKNQITIGDPIQYTVEINAPEQAQVIIPVYSGGVGEFQIVDFGDTPTRKENGRLIVSRWYKMTTFSTGELAIPPPKVTFSLASNGEKQEATGNELKINVVSLLAAQPGASDIHDIKPVEEPPFDWRPVGIAAGALGVIALIAFGFYYVLNRPKRQYKLPPTPAHEVALAALGKLRTRRYIEEGRFEAFYVELSSIARRYLEDRFHLRAPEMTTEEFLNTAGRDQRLSTPQRRLLSDFLAQADLVKFARALPTLNDSEAAYDAARRFVEETRPSAVAGPESRRAAA